jgi:uncharacterized membrane protein
MSAAESPPRREEDAGQISRRAAFAALALAFAVALWGGYGRHWSWTGINGRTATLWDWLHLLALPVAVVVLPIWLSRRTRVTRRHKLLGYCALCVFVALVLLGYLIPWDWTGFEGNTLWDWLELLALPLAVALAPVYRELRADWKARHSLIALVLVTVFVAVTLCGYLASWAWTGFRGNTFWDWLHLWLLPLLLPAVVVPALLPMVRTGVTVVAPPAQPSGSAESSAAERPKTTAARVDPEADPGG